MDGGVFLTVTDRIATLKTSGVISDEVAGVSLKAVDWLKNNHIDIESDNCQMFVTHLAMSLERIVAGESVEGLPQEMMEEVCSSKGYVAAMEFTHYLEQLLGRQLPVEERDYILLHLAVLIEVRGRCD
jgi:hypothetical protein